jgi:hypothetical protein
MKFTSFNPLIVTKEAAPVIELFEALGFERRHQNNDIDGKDITNVTMKDANGFHVDIAEANVQKDMTIIRMNVDDFDEAFAFLTEKGFTNPSGRVIEEKSSKSVMMVSPSGFAFDLCHHIKDHD